MNQIENVVVPYTTKTYKAISMEGPLIVEVKEVATKLNYLIKTDLDRVLLK